MRKILLVILTVFAFVLVPVLAIILSVVYYVPQTDVSLSANAYELNVHDEPAENEPNGYVSLTELLALLPGGEQVTVSAREDAVQSHPQEDTLITHVSPDPPELIKPQEPLEPTEPPEPAEQIRPPQPKKIAYLTFDDGPSRAVTPGILDVLAAEGILATFFVLSRRDVDDLFWRIINEGHEIGNHSATHNYSNLYNSGINAFYEDVMNAQNFLLERFDYQTNLYRFPGGSMGRDPEIVRQRKELLDEMGMLYYDWHIDSRDSHPNQHDRSAAAIAGNVLSTTYGRDRVIILMHDSNGRGTTLEALPGIIAGLREQGYSFDLMSNY